MKTEELKNVLELVSECDKYVKQKSPGVIYNKGLFYQIKERVMYYFASRYPSLCKINGFEIDPETGQQFLSITIGINGEEKNMHTKIKEKDWRPILKDLHLPWPKELDKHTRETDMTEEEYNKAIDYLALLVLRLKLCPDGKTKGGNLKITWAGIKFRAIEGKYKNLIFTPLATTKCTNEESQGRYNMFDGRRIRIEGQKQGKLELQFSKLWKLEKYTITSTEKSKIYTQRGLK